MIIDLILDRKDGEPYKPKDFYMYAIEYPGASDIASAMDSGTENDVKEVLCKYIDANDYSPGIKDYIRSVNWLD